MPRISGRDFADQAEKADPELKIVFMSGYPDDVATDHDALSPDTNYLQRPFTESTLLETLTRVLEKTATSPARANLGDR